MLARPIGLVRFTQFLLILCIGMAWKGEAQICVIGYSVFNKDRHVHGPINNECSSGGLHSAPFGNWGVDTESSDLHDGRQFEGWCKYRRLCDNNGDCKLYCKDQWYEWNSCTFHEWSPPNNDFYNHNNGTEQKSTRSMNLHGSGSVNLSVSCPYDSDGDYYNESGGCAEVLENGFNIAGHRMELYELDGKRIGRWFSKDTKVGTLRFPMLRVSTSSDLCDVGGCSKSSIGTWSSSSRSSSTRKASAKAAIQLTQVFYSDPYSNCEYEYE